MSLLRWILGGHESAGRPARPPRKLLTSPEDIRAANIGLRARYPKAVAAMKEWRVNLDADSLSAYRFLLLWEQMVLDFSADSRLKARTIRISFVAMDERRNPLHYKRRFTREEVL